jgi:hypothetical protein
VTGTAALTVSFVLVADEIAAARAAATLFPDAERVALGRTELRPGAPFRGRLFGLLAARPRGSCVGLVVPVVPQGEPPGLAGELVAVADHVNLELRGPLTGRWPAGVPRVFPAVAGIYQPSLVRRPDGPRVYSPGVVVAGVADAAGLTPFESAAVVAEGLCAVSDTLVPPAIVAAYHGLTLAACGVPRAPHHDRK